MVRENILRIRKRISDICAEVGCDPSGITVVAVSKARTIEEIKEALQAGITDIGENRVQEAVLKYKLAQGALTGYRPRWHMVGHLQTNKVKDALEIFDLIHSVDSIRLAEEIDRQAARINKVQGILIEIKTSPEAAKSGFSPQEAPEAIEEIARLKNLKLEGLMTIAPLAANQEESRPYFKTLRELQERINELNEQSGFNRLNVLSMGMSDDYQAAIEEGSNMLRLGRAIFGREMK